MARAARNVSIDPAKIQIVHVWNRCVRRAFLCGKDPLTGRDFEHRRKWARQRLEHLASIFAIDCITFAIMSNHTHQILRSRPDIVKLWSDRQIAERWLRLTPKRDRDGNPIDPTEDQITALSNDAESIAELRVRLSDVSWWMRYFSHHMACRANKEDSLKGHFWEARFGSELLIDNASLLACMIYVDLNPVRAEMAATPEESDYTGAKDRIDDLRISLGTSESLELILSSSQHSIHDWERLDHPHCGWLSPLEIDEAKDPVGPDEDPTARRASRKGAVAMSLTRYLELLDWAGRSIHSDKRGAIPAGLTPILSRIGLTPKSLFRQMLSFGSPHESEFVPGTIGDTASHRSAPIAVG
jgi:hypothetical protein